MDVKVELLGRSSIDVLFGVLGTETVELTGDKIDVAPAIPSEAAGMELRVRISAPDSVVFRIRHPANPARPFSDLFAVWGGTVTDGVPFPGAGVSVVIGHPGADLTA